MSFLDYFDHDSEEREEYYRRLEEENYFLALQEYETNIHEAVMYIQECLIWLHDNN